MKIYQGVNRKPDGRKYSVFTVSYFEAGKRTRKFFADRQEAFTEAERIAFQLNRGEHAALTLTSADASSYLHAVKMIEQLKMPLHVVVQEYAQAAKVLDGKASLLKAAQEAAERHKAPVTANEVEDVVNELLVERERANRSERYLESLRSHLNRFKAAFRVKIGSITAIQMEAWLNNIGATARTRNNFRGSLTALFHFAQKRGYLPRGIRTEADEIEKVSVSASVANIYTPGELQSVLQVAEDQILPAIAIGAFTGLRSASIARLSWESVKWEQGLIEIPAAIAKNRKRYLLPLLPCLARWLAPYRERKGRVFQGERMQTWIKEAFEAAKVSRLHNGLRDSYISYRVAETMNIPQVALEAGNSVEMIRSKYLEACTRDEAAKWFSVMPYARPNVISIGVAK